MNSPRHSLRPALAALVLALSSLLAGGAAAPGGSAEHPGATSDGRTRLPNGWTLRPAGRLVTIGDFPQAMSLHPDGRWAACACGSWQGGGFDVVDLASARRTQQVRATRPWLGVTFYAGGTRLAVTAGLDNRIDLYAFDAAAGRAVLADSIALGPAWSAGGQYPQGRVVDYGPGAIWPTAIAADEVAGRLLVVSRFDSSLRVLDPAARAVTSRVRLPGVPYACRPLADRRVAVSLWSAAKVAIVDPEAGRVVALVDVGEHPTDLAEDAGGRLFVANANEGTVSVVDLGTARVTETIATSPARRRLSGVTPDGLALDPARGRLYVANADANCVAVLDVSRPGQSRVAGFLPSAWYPTAVGVAPGGTIVVANGKGTHSSPTTIAPPDTGLWCGYLLYTLPSRGTVSIVPPPDAASLARATREVLRATPVPPRAPGRPVAVAGGPIRHVFYIFRENRSYDQVFGDLPQGDGDSSRCLFGEAVTPNAHALARRWVLFDNTYCDADGSADGHNWGMGAIANDYVFKGQGTSPVYDYEGGNELATPFGGYLWDACRRAGVSFRSYGEFVFNPDDPRDTVRAGLPSLEGHVAPHYRGYDLQMRDNDRFEAWREEFDRHEREGGLPALEIIRLANDHTEGTCLGRPTPRAHVAENDLALGRFVERISRSRYWKESAIFVIEDDAGNGPDHVDAHRTVALVASPWARRGVVDSRLYTNTSVLRTIERILGLPPMSAFDAAATPMDAAFTDRPDFSAWTCQPARVDLGETNLAGAWGQERSARMDFRMADAAPFDELNEIVWRATLGTAPPPPVRGAWTAARTDTRPAARSARDDD
jgi:YVTN family beta-propeller protein